MDYEKRLKEALSDVNTPYVITAWIEENFPELAESEDEDERIRRDLINFFKNESFLFHKREEIIAWLKKQGEKKINWSEHIKFDPNPPSIKEQKPVNETDENIVEAVKYTSVLDMVEPKFHEGDWVVTSYGKVNQVIAVDKDGDGFALDDDTYFSGSWKDDYHLWSIQDAKDGDVLYSPCLSLLWIFKSKDTVYCGCNLNYNDGAFCGEGYFERPTDAIPATKEQRDLLFQKMKDAGYEWDSEKKGLKKNVIEWKPADNTYYDDICELLLNILRSEMYDTINKDAIRNDLDWLRSLRERVQPKQEWNEEDEKEWKSIVSVLTRMHFLDELDWLRSKLNR